ncbi:quinoprotein relay system zinc metallohydrolase 2 [uncultured Rhodoblastus sp.]|uniref:quinoprotein relay system zinc metallohydrolase 2 n=1 Tax=uncultured Rhodoblastus sp. TaxID=543037 RepID=UPI0025E488A2|nr:quinoprotein relay system zinc metallohydrolase 2 [uncultured Rhodoblastus sp.]
MPGQAGPSAAIEIAPGAYVLPGVIALTDKQNAGQISNSGFIIGRDGVAVIDTGGSPAIGRKLRAAIRALTSKPILYVIFTHGHPDHILGAAAFVEDRPQFVGHRALPAAMAAHADDYLNAARNLLGEQEFAGTRIVPPTLLVDGETQIDLGNRRLKLESWPSGHTNADITITDEASGALFLGDLLFSGHIPALDGKLTGWLDNLQKLKQRQAKRAVPGHGPASVAWPEAAEAEEAYLRRLRDDVGEALREGRTIREAAGSAAATERGKWRLFDDFNPRNATAAYHELEWQ